VSHSGASVEKSDPQVKHFTRESRRGWTGRLVVVVVGLGLRVVGRGRRVVGLGRRVVVVVEVVGDMN